MTPQREINFYINDVLIEEFDYTVASDTELAEPNEERKGSVSKFTSSVAAILAGGILVFGPFGLSSPGSHVPSPEVQDVIVVRVQAPGSVEQVAIPDVHQQAAARFQKLFRAVPLNDVERLADPDYGL